MRRAAPPILALLLATSAAAQAPPAAPPPPARPVTLNALPAPDAAGRCLLRGGSEATYLLRHPVATQGVYTSILGPEGDPANLFVWPGTPGLLAALRPATPQPWQWAGGGVRLVRDPAGKGDGNALTLRDLEGDFTWPGPPPNQWSGVKSLAYTLDCSLASWESADGWPPIDLFGVYAGSKGVQTVALIAYKGGLGLAVVDSTGAVRSTYGTFPGGPLAPGTRGTIGVLIDAAAGASTITWNGTAIGSGTFTPPLAENTDGRFQVGAQSPRQHHDPGMTLYAFSQVVDGKVTALAIPPAPDWYFPPAFLLADRLEESRAPAAAPTDFRRLRITGHPCVAIGYGTFEGRGTVQEVDVDGGNVGLMAGLGIGGEAYALELDRVTLRGCRAAAIKASSADLAARSLAVSYPGRHAALQRGGSLRIDGLTLAPSGAPIGALFRGLATGGDRTIFGLRSAVLDFEGLGPPSYFDFDAAGRRGFAGTSVTLDGVAVGRGATLATLRALPGQADGSGVLALRDCTSDGPPTPAAAPGWAITGTLNGQPAPPPAPGRPPGPPAAP